MWKPLLPSHYTAYCPSQVVVTGAGGRTGGLVMKKLLERTDEFSPVGVVRSDASAKQLREWGATDDQIFVGDIVREGGEKVLAEALEGADRLVVCTSAVPKIKPLSLVPVILAKIFKREGVRPKFTFKEDQMPEAIDWLGQKKQFDAAKAAGVAKCRQTCSRFLYCSPLCNLMLHERIN